MTSFNLTYYRISDGKAFSVARLHHRSYKILIEGKEEPISKHLLNKDYWPDRKNRGAALRQTATKKRKVKTMSKAFREYLEGA